MEHSLVTVVLRHRRWIMRIFTAFLLATSLVVLFGCSRNRNNEQGALPEQEKAKSQIAEDSDAPTALSDAMMTTIGGRPGQIKAQAAQTQASMSAFDRKIIRNGELTIETDSPM
ncbi:MAG TPA: hypothetical protein VLR90_01190, partial [Blastocatellia bacterium]|nr:hypothetical protein [Blastocatellia bacterium]